MSDETEVKHLLSAVSMLIEHDTALIAQREEQDKATAALVNDLTAQLRDYQDREQQIKTAITTSTATETRKAVGTILNHYHNQLTEGVAGDVQRANEQLKHTASIATVEVENLSRISYEMRHTFDKRLADLNMFADTHSDQNKRLANDAKNTLIRVRKEAQEGAEQYTEELSSKFAAALSWKIACILGAICLFILLMTLFLGWLLIPSKAEIAERQTKFDSLAAAKIAHNVVRGQDGYYARIKPQSCFVGKDKYQYCKFR